MPKIQTTITDLDFQNHGNPKLQAGAVASKSQSTALYLKKTIQN